MYALGSIPLTWKSLGGIAFGDGPPCLRVHWANHGHRAEKHKYLHILGGMQSFFVDIHLQAQIFHELNTPAQHKEFQPAPLCLQN